MLSCLFPALSVSHVYFVFHSCFLLICFHWIPLFSSFFSSYIHLSIHSFIHLLIYPFVYFASSECILIINWWGCCYCYISRLRLCIPLWPRDRHLTYCLSPCDAPSWAQKTILSKQKLPLQLVQNRTQCQINYNFGLTSESTALELWQTWRRTSLLQCK